MDTLDYSERKDLKPALLIINPVSGKRMVLRNVAQIIRVLMDAGYKVTTMITGKKGDGTAFASSFGRDYQLVCCTGGDGTLNEVIHGLATANIDVPLKPLKDVMYILRVDAASIILYHNLDTRRQLLPRNTNCCTTFCMVKRIFHNIVDCLIQPITITKKRKMIRARQNDFFLFLSGSICKMQFNIPHHIRHILCGLLQHNGPGIQFCNLEQVLHQYFNAVKFLFG